MKKGQARLRKARHGRIDNIVHLTAYLENTKPESAMRQKGTTPTRQNFTCKPFIHNSLFLHPE
jgi:hypothetical protein